MDMSSLLWVAASVATVILLVCLWLAIFKVMGLWEVLS